MIIFSVALYSYKPCCITPAFGCTNKIFTFSHCRVYSIWKSSMHVCKLRFFFVYINEVCRIRQNYLLIKCLVCFHICLLLPYPSSSKMPTFNISTAFGGRKWFLLSIILYLYYMQSILANGLLETLLCWTSSFCCLSPLKGRILLPDHRCKWIDPGSYWLEGVFSFR